MERDHSFGVGAACDAAFRENSLATCHVLRPVRVYAAGAAQRHQLASDADERRRLMTLYDDRLSTSTLPLHHQRHSEHRHLAAVAAAAAAASAASATPPPPGAATGLLHPFSITNLMSAPAAIGGDDGPAAAASQSAYACESSYSANGGYQLVSYYAASHQHQYVPPPPTPALFPPHAAAAADAYPQYFASAPVLASARAPCRS